MSLRGCAGSRCLPSIPRRASFFWACTVPGILPIPFWISSRPKCIGTVELVLGMVCVDHSPNGNGRMRLSYNTVVPTVAARVEMPSSAFSPNVRFRSLLLPHQPFRRTRGGLRIAAIAVDQHQGHGAFG